MHQACTASALLCTTWAGQGSMELALAVAVDSSWPVHVRRTALLLVSVLCRGSAEAAQHFRQLEVTFLFVLLFCVLGTACKPQPMYKLLLTRICQTRILLPDKLGG